MKAELVNPIVKAAYEVLEEVLGTELSRRKVSMHARALPLHRISALAGLTGSLEGYAALSMPLDVALSIAAVITDDRVSALDDVTQAAIIGLMDTVMQEAVRQLREEGVEVRAAPAALFWGQSLQLSCAEIEAALVPLQMPLGSVEITVALRDSRQSY